MLEKEIQKGTRPSGFIVAVSLSALIALAACLVLLLVLSWLVSAGLLPEAKMTQLCMLVLAFSSLLGGRLAVVKGEGAPMLLALATGALLCVLLLLVAFAGFGGLHLEAGWGVLLSALIGAALAGLLRPKHKRVKHKPRKKR